MNIKRYCKLCGKEFRTGNGKAKYCSDECRKEAHKEKISAWLSEHPDYHKKWREAHPEYYRNYRSQKMEIDPSLTPSS